MAAAAGEPPSGMNLTSGPLLSRVPDAALLVVPWGRPSLMDHPIDSQPTGEHRKMQDVIVWD